MTASCAVVDTIDPRYDTINRSAAKARNESILLNIVRASQNVPLNFIAFSRVSGTTQANVGMAAPNFVIGPPPVPVTAQRVFGVNNTTLNTSMQASGSFDITVLESKDFYTALLSPVDLPTLHFFARQGYSRELLFWLFTDSVRETVRGRTTEYRNEPSELCGSPKGEVCFERMVDVAIATGLTVETHIEQRGGGGADGRAKAGPTSTIYARLCFDEVLARRAARDYPPDIKDAIRYGGGVDPRCSKWKFNPRDARGGKTDQLTFEITNPQYGKVHYEIRTRSVFGIYQFLGRILAEQMTGSVRLRDRIVEKEDRRILVVARDAAIGGCFVDLGFENSTYCVPQEGAENTKRIFSLLVQLLALKTQTGDLAITPTVRVTP